MKIYLGIDGGGTTTRAVLTDASGLILGEGKAGCGNYHNCGLADAVSNFLDATRKACKMAGCNPGQVEAAFLGCAGVKSAIDKARLTLAAETAGLAPAGEITVMNDLHNALAGGLAGKPGIALIAGTGTHALGRDHRGNTASCGGWGWLLDDVGGGLWIALSALRAAVRSVDGRGPQTALLPAGLTHLGLSGADELLARLHVDGWEPDELAAFAPVVTRLAAEGDEAAEAILREGAESLAQLVLGVASRLNLGSAPEIVLLGGCCRSGSPYQTLIEDAVKAVCPNARLCDPVYQPVYGAAFNVLRVNGIKGIHALNVPFPQTLV